MNKKLLIRSPKNRCSFNFFSTRFTINNHKLLRVHHTNTSLSTHHFFKFASSMPQHVIPEPYVWDESFKVFVSIPFILLTFILCFILLEMNLSMVIQIHPGYTDTFCRWSIDSATYIIMHVVTRKHFLKIFWNFWSGCFRNFRKCIE